jgi:hypothetical protein
VLTAGNPILGTATGSNALAAPGPTLSSADSNQRSGMTAPKPNVLFILADALGYADVSCYGPRDFSTPSACRRIIQPCPRS